jgi:hypothetical protein
VWQFGQFLGNSPGPFDRLHRVSAVLFDARADRQHERVEQDVAVGQAVLFDREIADALGDRNLSLGRAGHRVELVFVDRAGNDGRRRISSRYHKCGRCALRRPRGSSS